MHGGKRQNAGRPRGSKNAKTKALAKVTIAAAEAGILPVPFLLAVVRDETLDAAVRIDCAKAAAPYCHAKLSATVNANVGSGDDDGPLVVEIVRFVLADGSISAGPGKLIEHED